MTEAQIYVERAVSDVVKSITALSSISRDPSQIGFIGEIEREMLRDTFKLVPWILSALETTNRRAA